MIEVLLDTQMWVYYHLASKRMPPALLDLFERDPGTLAISAVTLWETTMLLQRGRIVGPADPFGTIRIWREAAPLATLPLDAETALLSRSLPFAHEDPADRFLAATAHRHGLTLATDDAKLLAVPWLATFPS